MTTSTKRGSLSDSAGALAELLAKCRIATAIMATETMAMLRLCTLPKRASTRRAAIDRSATLRAMAQQMVGQHARYHRLGHRCGADADARIMAALGAQRDLVAEAVDAAHRRQDRAGRLDNHAADDLLAARDATEDAAGVVAEENRGAVLDSHFIGVFFAAHGGDGKSIADLDALHRVDAHQRLGDIGVKLVVYRIAQADGDARGYDLDHRAARTAALAHVIEIAFPPLCGLAVGAPERIVRRRVPIPLAAVDFLAAELHDRAADVDGGTQDLAGDRPGSDTHRRLARRLPAAAAIVTHAVFLEIGVVGVRGTELVLDLGIIARALIDIVDMQGDRRAGGETFEYA